LHGAGNCLSKGGSTLSGKRKPQTTKHRYTRQREAEKGEIPGVKGRGRESSEREVKAALGNFS